MNAKRRLAQLEKQKPTANAIKTWREFIEADEETMKRYDEYAQANGLPTWAARPGTGSAGHHSQEHQEKVSKGRRCQIESI